MMTNVGNLKIGKKGNINARQMANVANKLPPGMMKQVGGFGGLQNLMKQFSSGGFAGLGGLGGLGGGGL